MKDVLRRGLLEPGVPHEADAVRIVGSVRVLVIRGAHELRERHRPIHGGHHSVLGPALVEKVPVQRQAVG